MTTTTFHVRTFSVGDKVVVEDPRWPGVWTVVKINQRTYGLEQAGRRLRADGSLLRAATGAEAGAAADAPEPVFFDAGQVVRSHNPKMGGLWVVLSHRDKVKVARLGGGGGRYWTVASPATLTVVPLGEVAQVLAG